MGLGLGKDFPLSRDFSFSGSSIFFCEFWEIRKICELQVLQLPLRDWLWIGHRENFIVYSLFFISIIIIVVIISVYFGVLLNCLYLSPQVLLFPILLPMPLGEEEWVSGWVILIAGCQVKPQHLYSCISGRNSQYYVVWRQAYSAQKVWIILNHKHCFLLINLVQRLWEVLWNIASSINFCCNL